MNSNIETLQQELRACLDDNILSFWLNNMQDHERGGFYGQMTGHDVLVKDAERGAILNARILWSFAAAYRATGNKQYLDAALRAKDYIIRHFYDEEQGGVFWSLNADGTPLDTKKQFYAIGFTIYGLSELVRATGDEEALDYAVRLFHDIESHSRDRVKGGYLEACTRDWQPIADMRLSDKDENAAKTMNTHLHIIEPYTNLYRVWRNDELREALEHLMHLFLDVMEDSHTHHLGLFFNEDWVRQDAEVSYGHDIEASWLLLETAQVLGDEALLEKTLKHTRQIADSALQGRCHDGSMVYERHANGHFVNDKHWWVQAECMIGEVYLYKFHGDEGALDWALRTWQYIKDNIVDKEGGEWFWSCNGGTTNRTDDKAGFWKCPYHNSRMCLEVMRVLSLQ